MEEAFHLVCHDCPEEGVYGNRMTAEAARERHASEADHRLSLMDVSVPPRTTADAEHTA